MKHASSRTVYAHWNDLRGRSAAPERSAIDPGAIKFALPDSFIISLNPLDGHTFRIAGTRVCTMFGRELKTSALGAIWDAQKRSEVIALARVVSDESIGVVAGVVGWTADGFSLDLELLLLPLRHGGRTHARLFGVLAPLKIPYWLGTSPLISLTLGGHRFLTANEAGREATVIATALEERRRRHGFVVHEGGRA